MNKEVSQINTRLDEISLMDYETLTDMEIFKIDEEIDRYIERLTKLEKEERLSKFKLIK